MEQTELENQPLAPSQKHQRKVTLSQLQRFLPLPPPDVQPTFPAAVLSYLSSPSFGSLSLKDQRRIQHRYVLAYRSHFLPNHIIEHLRAISGNKFTEQSLLQAVSDAAGGQGLIDWYLFARKVGGRVAKGISPSPYDAAALIQKVFRAYRTKKKEWQAYEAVVALKQTLQPRLLQQLQREVKNQALEHVQRNRNRCEQILLGSLSPHLGFIEFEQLVNSQLEAGLELKKVQYLFMLFEEREKAQLEQFRRAMLPEHKQIDEVQTHRFLLSHQLAPFVMKYMQQSFYSWQDLVESYKGYQPEGEELEIEPFYRFINHHCQEKLSWLHTVHLRDVLSFTCNLKYLFLKTDPRQLLSQTQQIAAKTARRLKLKTENPVFYSFRTILLILLSRCKSSKLTRQQFTQFIIKNNPILKYDAFYAVWRVYGSLINVQRIRKEANLPIFPCHLLLTLSVEQYENLAEELLQALPADAEVPYSKVEEKINLSTEFSLETLQLHPLPLQDYDLIDYRSAIAQIMPIDFEIKLRAYIFKKVSEKFVVLWRNIRNKRLANEQLQKALLQLIPQQKQQKKEEKKPPSKHLHSRQLSKLSRKVSLPSESSLLIRDILSDIIGNIQQREKIKEQETGGVKEEFVLACSQKYSFRASLTRVSFHYLLGTIACSREFIALKNNRQQRLNIKLPFRPGIVPLDFAVWNNQLAVLTSLSSLELYTLGQSQIYPTRTIQLSKHVCTQKDYDLGLQQRLHRQLPWMLRPEGLQLIVSVPRSQELVFVNHDPTVALSSIPLSFREHFFPSAPLTYIPILLKKSTSQRHSFVNCCLAALQKNDSSLLSNCVEEVSMTKFDCQEWLVWLQRNGPISRCLLQSVLELRKNLSFSPEVDMLLKLVRQYMLQRNLSVRDLLNDMGCLQTGISAKEVKKYLGKVVGYESMGAATEGWLQGLSLGKKIEYYQLATAIGREWPFLPIQKPLLIPSSFFMLPAMPILVYTLDGFSQIFLRNTQDHCLVAILESHNTTPIIHFVAEQYMLFSAESGYQKGHQQLAVWRLQEDIFSVYRERPPWRVQPHGRVPTGHQAPITSIAYSSRSNVLLTASLDGALKFWRVQSPFSITEIKRIYAQEAAFLHVSLHTVELGENIRVETLMTVRTAEQISTNNAYPYEMTVQAGLLELMTAKVPAKVASLPSPLKLVETMIQEGTRKAIKKKALLSRWEREEIQKIGRGVLTLKSLDFNFYGALKAAFIFRSEAQLKALVEFLRGKKFQDMVLSKVKEQCGLQLLSDLPAQKLSFPPTLVVSSNRPLELNQLFICEDSWQQIWAQLGRVGPNIEEGKLRDLFRPHLYGLQQEQFSQLLKSIHSSQVESSQRMYKVADLKTIIKCFPLEGAQGRLLAVMRALQRKLKRSKIPLWSLFSLSLSQLQKNKRIRTSQLAQKMSSLGLSREEVQTVTQYLSRNGTVNLFQFLHFSKTSIEDANPSELLSNYSSIVLGQSLIIKQKKPAIDETIQEENLINENEEMGKSLQVEVREMLQKKQSKMGSEQGSLHDSDLGRREEELSRSQLRHSTSMGSLSRSARDEVQRKAQRIISKLSQLLKNEGKTVWEIVAVACQNFIREPLRSDSQYFSIFDYLRTPLRLWDKLELLAYLQREGAGRCDLNALFDLVQHTPKMGLHGEKYLLLDLLECLQSHFSSILDEALQKAFFTSSSEIDSEGFLTVLGLEPFRCSRFALTEWQLLLKQEKLTVFGIQEVRSLLELLVSKHHLNIQFNRLGLIAELLVRVDQKGQSLYQLFPKTKTIDFNYFKEHTSAIQLLSDIEEDYRSLTYSLGEGKMGLKAQLPYEKTIKEIQLRMGRARQEEGQELQAARKLVKGLQARRMSPFEFFISMDRNKQFFITKEQLEVGLVELGINYDLWGDIPKKNSKRLRYLPFILYLTSKRLVSYKSADSQLDVALDHFLKKFIRHEDLEIVFRRLAGTGSEVGFTEFQKAIQRVGIQQNQTRLLFGLLVNENVVRGRRWGNDEAILDPSNLGRSFNFRQFAEAVLAHKTTHLTKTGAFRFIDYFKRRGISLFFQFKKWLDANRKLKEVGEALKKNSQTLQKDTLLLFLSQLKTGLSEQELKELLSRYPQEVDFQTFMGQLQDVHRRAKTHQDKEEVQAYLQDMASKMRQLGVGLPRLLKDYSDGKGKLAFEHLAALSDWLGTGLTKIQLRKVLTVLDLEKEGRVRAEVLGEAVEQAQQQLGRDEEDCRLEYALQKLMKYPEKYVLKGSRLAFTQQRANIIFEAVLVPEQCELLMVQARKQLKKDIFTEKQMQQFVEKRVQELRRRSGRKDKETALRVISCLGHLGVEIEDAFSYFSKHNPKELISRQEFLLLLQSLEQKLDLTQISNLFQFLDERQTGSLGRQRWEEKLSLVKLQQEQHLETGTQEQIRLFYRVKLFLGEVYLLCLRKGFKRSQIFHFFDTRSSGTITSQQLLESLSQLGLPPDQDLAPKLTNFLDRNRDGRLSVTLLLQELEQCLGSRMRQVLATRSAILFREKSKVFAHQAPRFVAELAQRQELIHQEGSFLSVINEGVFLDLMTEFGCPLAEDEIQDVRHNFQGPQEGLLLLYPIYRSLTSLFTGPTTAISHRQLYQRLMKNLTQKQFTLEQLSKTTSAPQLLSFLQQLGIFTSVEAKALVQENLYSGSRAVDYPSLKLRLRDAHLTQQQQSSLFKRVDPVGELTRALSPVVLREVLGGNRGRVDLSEFERLLWECGVWVTRGTARSWFQAFAKGGKLELTDLLQVITGESSKIIVAEEKTKGEMNLFQNGALRVSEHLVKSLNLRRVSLEEALTGYFRVQDNFGFVTERNLLSLLQETGLSLQKHCKDIAYFLDHCRRWTHQLSIPPPPTQERKSSQQNTLQFDNSQIIAILPQLAQETKGTLISIYKLEEILALSSQWCHPQIYSHRSSYSIQSEQLRAWLKELSIADWEGWLGWLAEEGLQQYNQNNLIRLLLSKCPQHKHLLALLLKTVPSHIDSYKELQDWTRRYSETGQGVLNKLNLEKNARRGERQTQVQILNSEQNQTHLRGTEDNMTHKDQLTKILIRDPLRTYKNAVQLLTVISPPPPPNGLPRISAALLLQHLISAAQLVSIAPSLLSPHPQLVPSALSPHTPPNCLTRNASVPVEEEKAIDQCGLLMINNKYLALPLPRKFEFECIAGVAQLLHPQRVFYRDRHLFLWEPPQQLLPCRALSLRWTHIIQTARTFLSQFQQIHNAGYCLPHLRWNQLSKDSFITVPLYPCPLAPDGSVRLTLAETSLNYFEPYCPPEYFLGGKKTLKVDSWIFGCILYQYIWGHPPCAPLPQLQQHLKSRQAPMSLAEALALPQLPQEFKYTFFDILKMGKLLSIEHQLSLPLTLSDLGSLIIREQSFSGLLLPLQFYYGEQLPLFREDFKTMTKLHQLIWQCLSLDPACRPSIEQMLKLPLLQAKDEVGGVNQTQYLYQLQKLPDSLSFYEQCIQPLIEAVISKQSQPTIEKQCLLCLERLIRQSTQLTSRDLVHSQLVIPRQYPWPRSQAQSVGEEQQFPYSQQMSDSKDSISQHRSFTLLAQLFKSGLLDIAILIAQQKPSLARQVSLLLELLLPTFHQYSPTSAFVPQFLDYLLKLLYVKPSGFLFQDWYRELPPPLNQILSSRIKQAEKGIYLRKNSFEGETQTGARQLLSRVVLKTGEGSAQYLPIAHFLSQHPQRRLLFETVFKQLELQSRPTSVLAYFTDSLLDPQKSQIQLACRIEVDVLYLLQQPFKFHALNYLKQLLSIQSSTTNTLPVFLYHPIYLQLARILRDPSSEESLKKLTLQMVGMCLRSHVKCRVLLGSSANVLVECVRLMVEPGRGTAAHEQHLHLRSQLQEVAGLILQDPQLLEGVVSCCQGSLGVLQEMREDGRLQLQSVIL